MRTLLLTLLVMGTLAVADGPARAQREQPAQKRKPNFTVGKDTTRATGPVDADGYIVGAPELVAEVAASNASYDLHDKLEVYRQNGVREYLVWRVFDRAVDWFVLRGGRYDRLSPTPPGVYRSEVLPGLWLDPAAIMGGDLARVLQVAQHGISSPEHTVFVDRLRQAGGQP